VIRWIMQHDPTADVANRRVVERGPHLVQEIGCGVTIIIGEGQDFATGIPYPSVVRISKAWFGLKHVVGWNASTTNKLPDNGSCRVGGSVIYNN
jgi:hypothetical protein